MAAFRFTLSAFSAALLFVLLPAGNAQSTENSADQISVLSALAQLATQEKLVFSFERGPLEELSVSKAICTSWTLLEPALVELGIFIEQTGQQEFILARKQILPTETEDYILQILGNGEPLQGATVVAEDGRSWVLDAYGSLRINRNETPLSLDVQYLGFQGQRIYPRPETTLSDVRELRPDTLLVATAYVICKLPTTDYERNLTSTRPARADYGGLILGPRNLQKLGFSSVAGASFLEGGSARPRLRGSLATETLVQLDGTPIYHLDHFFGLFNAVNPQVIKDITLYRSHYPADRGGYRGGMMDIETTNPKKTGIQLDVNQLYGSATAQIKEGDLRLVLGGRTTLQDLAQTSVFDAESNLEDQPAGVSGVTSPSFSFGDYYAKLRFQPAKSPWEFGLSAFGSQDEYSLDIQQNDAITFQRGGRLSFQYEESNRWENQSFGASLKRNFEKTSLEVNAYQTRYNRSLASNSTGDFQGQFGEREADITQTSLTNEILDQQVEIRLNPRKNEPANWTVGAQFQQLSTLAIFTSNERIPVDLDRTSNRIHLFGFHQNKLWDEAKLSIGIRASHAFDLDETWASPRLNLAQGFGDYTLSAGYSYTRQAIRTLDQENPFGQRYSFYIPETNEQGGAATAQNFTLGLDRKFEGAKLSLEGYYRNMPGTLANISALLGVSQISSIFTPQPLFSSLNGLGKVLGVDLDFSYTKGPWEGQVAYTLSSSQQRFDQIANNAWLRAPDDRRHRFATTHTFSWKAWKLSGNYEGASGFQFTDLSLLDAQATRRETNPAEYQNSLPVYHRIDLSGSWEHALSKGKIKLGICAYNVLDRANVAYRQYIVFSETQRDNQGIVPVGTDVSLLGRLVLFELGYTF